MGKQSPPHSFLHHPIASSTPSLLTNGTLLVPDSPFPPLPSMTKPSAGAAVGTVAVRAVPGRCRARGTLYPCAVSTSRGCSRCASCSWAEGPRQGQKGPDREQAAAHC